MSQTNGSVALSAINTSLNREPGDLSVLARFSLPMRQDEFETTLWRVIDRVTELCQADRAWVALHESERAEFVVLERVSGHEGYFLGGRWPLSDGGIAARVFRTGKPCLTNDLAIDHFALKSLDKVFPSCRMIAVPLEIDDRRIGVFMMGEKRNGEFTESDLRVTVALIADVNVQLQNTRLLENERQTVADLRQLNEVVDRQRAGLLQTLAIHDEFTRLVLDGGDVPAIVGALSRLLGNPVSVEDRFGSLVCHYPVEDAGGADDVWCIAITKGGTPVAVLELPVVQELRARLRRERRAIRIAADPALHLEKPRVLAPVVAGSETLAFIVVMESQRTLDEFDLMAVERAANAIALQMTKEKAVADAQYKLLGDFVMELLHGRFDADELLLRRAAYLDIDLRIPRSVLVIGTDSSADLLSGRQGEKKVLALKDRLLSIAQRFCQRVAPGSVLVANSKEIIILRSIEGNVRHDRGAELREFGNLLRAEVRRWLPEITVSVGIGSCCLTAREYARSYQEACQALDVIRASGQGDRTLDYQAVGIAGLLFDQYHRQKLVKAVDQALCGLLEYDRRHDGELTETLDAYLRHDGHLENTSAALHVHINTLRYRLQRIEQILGVDLRNAEVKLNLHLALNVLRAIGREPGLHGVSEQKHPA